MRQGLVGTTSIFPLRPAGVVVERLFGRHAAHRVYLRGELGAQRACTAATASATGDRPHALVAAQDDLDLAFLQSRGRRR